MGGVAQGAEAVRGGGAAVGEKTAHGCMEMVCSDGGGGGDDGSGSGGGGDYGDDVWLRLLGGCIG